MRWIYSCLFYLGMPFIWLRLLWRARRNPDYAQRWNERLGHVPVSVKPHGIWWHAVSVGEVLAAVPLIKAFQQHYPDVTLLVTTMTPTGSAQVKACLGASVQHVYAPYDLPHAIRRFLQQVQPRLLIIMETELWPNVLAACHHQDIPVILTNARLSEKSARGYARFSQLTREMLQQIIIVAAQHQADAERFLALGVPEAHLHVTGTVKFDLTVPETLLKQAQALRQQWQMQRPVWIAASTHHGEEKIILTAMQKIRAALPEVLLLLVPRHPERAKEIIALCAQNNLTTCTRSSQQLPAADTTVFLIDTFNELMLFYAASDVAFVGGSLVNKGGHNVLEPAALALPIITGPSMYNFAEIERLLRQANALLTIHNAEELATQVLSCFNDKTKSASLGNAAQAVVTANRGATAKQLALIEQVFRQT